MVTIFLITRTPNAIKINPQKDIMRPAGSVKSRLMYSGFLIFRKASTKKGNNTSTQGRHAPFGGKHPDFAFQFETFTH